MELTESLFNAYFKNQISLENFIERLGIYENDFLDYLMCEMVKVIEKQDAMQLEYLIYTLFLWDERMGKEDVCGLEKFLDKLNELLVADWHYKHEDITWLLQKISSIKSIRYLYDAIELHPQYLSWDDNYSFEVKCVRAIYHIGKEESFSYLEKLCKHPNSVISEMAQRQMGKLI
ncbi:MAG: hypothetical protein HDR00_10070 [Lachnospiraceae bacterium]|nr:hypothetical protein [Lachnospiraceae bacterium]